MTTTVKIAIGTVLALIAAIVIYLLLRKKTGANKYGSAEAVAAGQNGTYGKFDPSASSYKYDALWSLGIGGDYSGSGTSSVIYNADAYGQAWFKGMNIQLNQATADRFKSDVKAYASDTSLRKPHWDISVGEFLKAPLLAI